MSSSDTPQTSSKKSEAAEREERVLSFWKEKEIFQKSLKKSSPKGEFVFYEGPPTANGRPGVHHLASRAFKDALPRYKTMRGYHVARRAGWDTHGLPVELEVEKQLGFSGKQDIEKYGIAAFNKKCRESVHAYVDEWQRFTDRIGYWVDHATAYYTYDPKFMESVWAITKKIADDSRLYQDYKVLPWCPVCGTALSSHELAQGYEDVKDLAITAKFELINEPGTFFLAWTTTPWTLPGNVALAVGPDIEYVKVKTDGGNFIVAKERLHNIFGTEPLEITEVMLGKDLVGLQYTPLYPFAEAIAQTIDGEAQKFESTAYRVHAAEFVTTEDGTGIVHTAVMYGQEDFELGQHVGLPKVHVVSPDGRFVAGTGFLEGKSVIEPETNIEILKDLQQKGRVFSKESYTHSYPHCWRSKNRLVYYARDSWFIRMHDLRETMLAENAKTHWEPEHIREGRMGEWLANAKEWAVSRERYWGTPLPIWQSEDGTERIVVGSIEELKARTKKNGNVYRAMRHGEAEHNAANIIDCTNEKQWPLTEQGVEQVKEAAASLKDAGITRIVASPFARTTQTAHLVAMELGLPDSAVTTDDRLRELNFGDLHDRPFSEFLEYEDQHIHSFDDALPNGESYQQAKERFGAFLHEFDQSHSNESVLIVTHGIGCEVLSAVVVGADSAESLKILKEVNAQPGQVYELPFVQLPHNEKYELDLHRPYIDDVVLVGDSGAALRRVPEVMDVWFDSGSMPFAQEHYPFAAGGDGELAYPADFISEGIDQTRGWFYTLLAIGVLMGKGSAYKAVICLGHLLDAEGKKMSKSKGNVINPWEAMDQWGVDTIRFWMYSVNQPGDTKNFDEKTVKEAARVLSWFENSVKFYALFKNEQVPEESESDSVAGNGQQVIDRWILARLYETTTRMTESMDALRPYEATRALAKLLEDVSQWYVRRIRDRARDGDQAALRTLHHVLIQSAKLIAPFSPFIAEDMFAQLRSEHDPESVHLTDWPESDPAHHDDTLIAAMAAVRDYASQALMLRNKASVPVRQPLATLTIPEALSNELATLLAEEVNVEEVVVGESLALDFELTDALRAKGDERAFARAIAEARKAEGLSPTDAARAERNETGPYSVELSTGTVKFALVRE